MQRSQVICLACRRQRAVVAAHRALATWSPHWPSRASSTAIPAKTPPVQHYSDDEFVPSIDFPNTSQQKEIPKDAQLPEPRFKHIPRRSDFRKHVSGDGNTEESLKIFRRVVKQQADQEKPTEVPRDLTPGAVQFYSDLSRLRPMIKEESIEACFDFFMTKLLHNSPFPGRNRLLKQRGTYLMGKVAEAKAGDMDNKKLPSVAQITQLLHDLDSLSTTKWTNLIMDLIGSIISRSADRADYASSEAYEEAMARKEELLEDLVESWVVFHRHRLMVDATEHQSSEEAEFRLPPLDEAALQACRRGDLVSALGLIFPPSLFKSSGEHNRVPAAALATFVLMTDPIHSTTNSRQKAKPLLRPIARILTVVRMRDFHVLYVLEPYPEILAYVRKLWNTTITRLHAASSTGPQRVGKEEGARVPQATPGQNRDINTIGIHAQVTDALKMGDVAIVEAAWAQYWGKGIEDAGRMEQLRKHGGLLFDYIIMAFTALRRPRRAIDVWDAMVSIGEQPTLKTWTSMIEGCRRARNQVGLDNVWRKLVASGIRLDSVAWSARIVGLIDCGEPEAGLRALNEMRKLSKLGGAAPTVDTINAAVAGLIRLNAMSAARKVLSWASENGIDADVVTYNTFLRPMVFHGDARGVATLLQSMSEQKVKPDGATWTILLDGLINSTKDLSPAEQAASVKKLIADIEAAGAEANMETYARMIHLLLRDGKYLGHHTEGALGIIWGHMHEKGLRPSTHIYTMLVDHYFRSDPPAVAEVDNLLSHRELHFEGSRADRIFWERVISGFASAGYVDRAFEFFTTAGHAAAWMTLAMLETLLRSLVREGRMAEAQSVVDKVKLRRRGGANAGAHEEGVDTDAEHMFGGVAPARGSEFTQRRHWNHGFWTFAHERGLLPTREWRELVAGGQTS